MSDEKLTLEEVKELIRQMDEFKLMESEAKFNLKKIQEEIEKVSFKLQEAVKQSGKEELNIGIYNFGWKTRTRKAFDQGAFGQIYPHLLEKFKIETTTRYFAFTVNKNKK